MKLKMCTCNPGRGLSLQCPQHAEAARRALRTCFAARQEERSETEIARQACEAMIAIVGKTRWGWDGDCGALADMEAAMDTLFPSLPSPEARERP